MDYQGGEFKLTSYIPRMVFGYDESKRHQTSDQSNPQDQRTTRRSGKRASQRFDGLRKNSPLIKGREPSDQKIR